MALDLYPIIGPLVRTLPSETAHNLAIRALERGLVPSVAAADPASLRVELWGMTFTNPMGLAAGFDKNARVVEPMLTQGFGFVEVGTVTPHPQPGQPKPRMFRLDDDEAAINRLGFNNEGHLAVYDRLKARRQAPRAAGLVGVNIGRNANTEEPLEDYAEGVLRLGPVADYLVLNISSPNTPGLRALQEEQALSELLVRVLRARQELRVCPPLLLKLSPDLTDRQRADLVDVLGQHAVDGLIISNTTTTRPDSLRSPARKEAGGLSGRPLLAPSTRLLAEMYRATGGRLPMIGVGGIFSGADAYAKIRHGASLLQLYTALIFHGPRLVQSIKKGLAEQLAADGFSTVQQAVGVEASGQ
mgnify:CR=1 FL=1